MRNLLLLLIILTLFGALVFFGISIYQGSKDDGVPAYQPSDSDNNTGTNGNNNGNTGGNGGNTGDNTGGNTGGNSGTDNNGGSTTDNNGTGTNNGGGSTTDNGTEDDGNLPSTALISDTADKILLGILAMLVGAFLIRTNFLGKVFLPISEYFTADFFDVDSNPRRKRKIERQLSQINEAIKRRNS